MQWLTEGDHFEGYFAKKFNTTKRFGLEGCESLIPGMKAMQDTFADLGGESIVIGMPHRGRLNVLANIAQKPYGTVLSLFSPFPSLCLPLTNTTS